MKIYIISLLLLIIGCKKSHDPLLNYKDNNISITVSSAAGVVGTFNFHGELAPMSHYFPGAEFYAYGKTSSTDTQIIFSQAAFDPSGTQVSCTYSQPFGNTYNTPSTNPGTITFTNSSDRAEGSFTAKCGYLSDTLIIQGTFSGHCN